MRNSTQRQPIPARHLPKGTVAPPPGRMLLSAANDNRKPGHPWRVLGFMLLAGLAATAFTLTIL